MKIANNWVQGAGLSRAPRALQGAGRWYASIPRNSFSDLVDLYFGIKCLSA